MIYRFAVHQTRINREQSAINWSCFHGFGPRITNISIDILFLYIKKWNINKRNKKEESEENGDIYIHTYDLKDSIGREWI